MRLPLKESHQIHTVRDGYYFKDDIGLLYFFPSKGKKQLLQLRTTAREWQEILEEK